MKPKLHLSLEKITFTVERLSVAKTNPHIIYRQINPDIYHS